MVIARQTHIVLPLPTYKGVGLKPVVKLDKSSARIIGRLITLAHHSNVRVCDMLRSLPQSVGNVASSEYSNVASAFRQGPARHDSERLGSWKLC